MILVLSFSNAMAQNVYERKDSISAGVIVNKDPRIDILASKQAEINKRATILSGPAYRRGYRIQVANTQNRDEANTVKAELLRRFPDEKAYLLYQAPHFRVRIGNFLTQKDAQPLRKMIASLYPQHGIYIVPDLVEYKRIEEEDINN
jgi:uncharacterized protein (DUF433 family)